MHAVVASSKLIVGEVLLVIDGNTLIRIGSVLTNDLLEAKKTALFEGGGNESLWLELEEELEEDEPEDELAEELDDEPGEEFC